MQTLTSFLIESHKIFLDNDPSPLASLSMLSDECVKCSDAHSSHKFLVRSVSILIIINHTSGNGAPNVRTI